LDGSELKVRTSVKKRGMLRRSRMNRLLSTVCESSKWNELRKWFAYASVIATAAARQPAHNRLMEPVGMQVPGAHPRSPGATRAQ